MARRTLSFAALAIVVCTACKAGAPVVTPVPANPAQAVVIAPAPDAGNRTLLYTHGEALARVEERCKQRDVNVDTLRKPWEASNLDDTCDAPESVQNAIARATRLLGRDWEVDSVGCEHVFGRVVMLRSRTTDALSTARWTPKKVLERTPSITWSEADVDGDGAMETLRIEDPKPPQTSRMGQVIWADGATVSMELHGQFHVRAFEGHSYLVDSVGPNQLFFAPRDLRVFRIERSGAHLEADLPLRLWQASKPAREQYPALCDLQDETGWKAINLEQQIALLGEDAASAHALSVALKAGPSVQPEEGEGETDGSPGGFESTTWVSLWPAAAVHCPVRSGDEGALALATARAIELANLRGELLIATSQVLGCDGRGRALVEQQASGMLNRNQIEMSRELYRIGTGSTLEEPRLRGELATSADFTGDGQAESVLRTQDAPLALSVTLLTGESFALHSQWSMAALTSIRLPRDDRDSLLVTRDNYGDPDVRVFRFDGKQWRDLPRAQYEALYKEATSKYNTP